MGIAIMLLAGILVGWQASIVGGGGRGGGIVCDMVVGLLGALIASFLFGGTTFLGDNISVISVLWSVVGAITLLLILRLFRSGLYRRW
jgi:uncharacterized membrane protein YeaQ/YmgE (transglycosylase-associated protein family)